ncbi:MULTISPECIES: fatty acid desaturase [Burkholderia]|uniref:Fatty acid desaturase n=1 Tax=Burkholderia sola TaxID=2843302 RepID=A0ABV2C904_9BURK|nr:fatty acid desaturase [Burkholderia sp. CpTa8-5]MBP0607647.1 fatty acid desaturase [Burkholderia sp. CpTa8-5]
MRGLPGIAQPVLTWMTGKPLDAAERPFGVPRTLDVVVTFASSMAILGALVELAHRDTLGAWAIIVVFWLVLVGLLRKMQVTHLHHAIHNRLFERPSLNKLYARVIPSLIFVQNGVEYRREHLEHHNSDIFTTERDADAAFLAKLGFIPGRERGELWVNLWMTVASPVFHIMFARARLESVFLRNRLAETLVALAMLAGHAVLIVLAGWKAYIIAVLVPMFFIYHVSALLQFLTEHAWNIAGESVADWHEYASRCWGRFCGERFPLLASGSNYSRFVHVLRVAGWVARMLVFHLPVRVACLVADLPAHDWHHLAHMAGQNSRDWSYSLYLRQAAIDSGDRAGFALRELWGMHGMIEHQFSWLESITCTYSIPNVRGLDNAENAAINSGELK